MNRKFQIKVVPSTWLDRNDRRLDCGPYMSGAIEAQESLRRFKTMPLGQLTAGYKGGIYNGSPFVRNFVDDPDHGVPFLTTSSLLQADLSGLAFLSKRDALSKQLKFLEIKPGMTLITCSGTIGRMTYARADMNGVWSNQDIMKIVADPSVIKSGYLYAFLCSRFGVPLIVSGTYGAIIQHIEPHHIADLPVPRLGEVEQKAHELVQKAADKRVEASHCIAEGIARLESAAGLARLGKSRYDSIPFGVNEISSRDMLHRMDGSFHSAFHQEVIRGLRAALVPVTTVLNRAIAIFEPKRFKRVTVHSHEFGYPMFGTAALMWAEPQPSYFIPRRMRYIDELLVDERTVLVSRSGQVSGIIGSAVLPFGPLLGAAVSEHAIRIRCASEVDAGFIYLALRSEYGRRQLKARAYGSSIPSLDVQQVGQTLIPDVTLEITREVGMLGVFSAKLRDEATKLEGEARSLVEHTIEAGEP